MQAQESLDDSGDDKKAQLEHETALKGFLSFFHFFFHFDLFIFESSN